MSECESEVDVGNEYFLSLNRQYIGYDGGYWATFRVTSVEKTEERPHGFQYSLSFHDPHDDRIFGYNNAHAVDAATGPARKSKRPKPWDHITRRGRKSVPYAFTTPYQLVQDFFTEVDEYLKKEGVP